MVAKFENSTYSDIDKYKEYRKRNKKNQKEKFTKWFEEFKRECLFCKEKNNLVFHHVNSNEKKYDVCRNKSKKSVLSEIVKCWCLCEDCHIKLHQRLVDPLPSTWDIRITVP